MHPAGIEPASQESESYVLSIILRLPDGRNHLPIARLRVYK